METNDGLSRKSIIDGYSAGANISIVKCFYIKSKKIGENKYSDDYIFIVYKDLNTGEKKFQCIPKPKYRFFMLNDGLNENISYNRFFIESSKVHPVEYRYKYLKRAIAEETGNLEWYKNVMNSGKYKELDRLFKIPTVFEADINIEDFYRFEFSRLYKNDTFEPTKLYFDIEANNAEINYDFPTKGNCTVNAISVVDDVKKKVSLLLLEDMKNPEFIKFINSSKDLNGELRDFVFNHVGGMSKVEYYGLDKFNFEIIIFKQEIKLIANLFNIINTSKPDFVMAWNMAFDLPYLIDRLYVLGYEPSDIICHPDFPVKICGYYIDNTTSLFEERCDYSFISSYSEYIDQMIQFASKRKGQRAIGSYKLNDIGEVIAEVKKVNYSDLTLNIGELPYIDYKRFAFYNACDSIVQYCIEHETEDINYALATAIVNNTRYAKIHRQTVYLHNRAVKTFYHMGYIMGCNVNKNNPKTEFIGAYVSDPLLLSDLPKLKIHNRPVNVLYNLVDMDYTALYPSTNIQNNMAPNTMIGKIILPEQINIDENKFMSESFDRSTSFIEDMLSCNWIDFMYRWYGLPSYEEMYDLIYQYFSSIKNSARGLQIYNNITGKRYLTQPAVQSDKRLLYYLIDKDRNKKNMVINTLKIPSRKDS